ncbi:PspA/IM30 family protein [Vibrio nitrifigilis]|uniref:PspA/IM30 family protein n=1 Tax=Vibrio nitrifigilis TaxID=2789781 RepID=A0ABS0GBG6_9VIBR|nr:PspA/IM30 family protein [Vibrio nitrifigilis]MBF8999760.1 PspA/IM30 family protein [Vibrio nitrifigilis]
MSVFKKLFSAFKGGINDAAESVVDANQLRILEQEIREVRSAIRDADESLVSIMAKRKIAEKKVSDIQLSITQYEQNALSASEKGHQDLALECAQRVVELTQEKDVEQSQLDVFLQAENKLRTNVSSSKSKLKQLEQQLDLVKATGQVQKAQAATNASVYGASSKTSTALDSLNRIKELQSQKQAELEAQEELHDAESGQDLDKKLADAGINGERLDAQSELERILGKK